MPRSQADHRPRSNAAFDPDQILLTCSG